MLGKLSENSVTHTRHKDSLFLSHVTANVF